MPETAAPRASFFESFFSSRPLIGVPTFRFPRLMRLMCCAPRCGLAASVFHVLSNRVTAAGDFAGTECCGDLCSQGGMRLNHNRDKPHSPVSLYFNLLENQ